MLEPPTRKPAACRAGQRECPYRRAAEHSRKSTTRRKQSIRTRTVIRDEGRRIDAVRDRVNVERARRVRRLVLGAHDGADSLGSCRAAAIGGLERQLRPWEGVGERELARNLLVRANLDLVNTESTVRALRLDERGR